MWWNLAVERNWDHEDGLVVLEGGRLVIRSTESCLKGRVVEEEMGVSRGVVGWVLTLFY